MKHGQDYVQEGQVRYKWGHKFPMRGPNYCLQEALDAQEEKKKQTDGWDGEEYRNLKEEGFLFDGSNITADPTMLAVFRSIFEFFLLSEFFFAPEFFFSPGGRSNFGGAHPPNDLK